MMASLPKESISISTVIQLLSQLRKEVQEIPSKDAFTRAQTMAPDDVDDETFRLMFLRAEKLDAKAAARRLVEHFQHKMELFGADSQSRQVGLATDLNDNDLHLLSIGGIKFFHSKEGRCKSVLVFNYGKMSYKANMNMIRAFWSLLASASANEEVQANGIDVVGFAVNKDGNHSPSNNLDPDLLRELVRCTRSLPVSIASVHRCSLFGAGQDLLTELIARQGGIEVEVHNGSYYDCVSQLVTTGLPGDVFSAEFGGKISDEGTMLAGLTGKELDCMPSAGSMGQKLPKGHPGPALSFGFEDEEMLLARLKSLQSLDTQPRRAFPPMGSVGTQETLADGKTGTTPSTNMAPSDSRSPVLPFLDYSNAPQHGLPALGGAHVSQMMFGMHDPQELAQIQSAAASGNTGLSQVLSHCLQNNLSASMGPASAPIDIQIQTPSIDWASLLGAANPTLQVTSEGGSVQVRQETPQEFHALQDESLDQPVNQQLRPHNQMKPGVDHPPICLYTERDSDKISSYQCVARQQIELFAATEDDVQFNTSKMNKAIVAGQVGIRCRHCAVLPQYSRPKAAVYYPRTLHSLYQFGQNMIKNHLCASCKLIPDETKRSMESFREERRRGRGGREHWADAASALGVYEDSHGLRFG